MYVVCNDVMTQILMKVLITALERKPNLRVLRTLLIPFG